MPKYAILENKVIVNVIEADEQYAAQHELLAVTDNVGIGWTFDAGAFGEPALIEPPKQPTKEQLMAELAALTAKIQALE